MQCSKLNYSILFYVLGTYFRIVNGKDTSSGRVEVSINGAWGTVCDTYWDNFDARALCRQMGKLNTKKDITNDRDRPTVTKCKSNYMNSDFL